MKGDSLTDRIGVFSLKVIVYRRSGVTPLISYQLSVVSREVTPLTPLSGGIRIDGRP